MTSPLVNRAVSAILRSPAHRTLSSSLILLEVTGAKSGNRYRFPVQFAETADGLVIWPGHAKRKTWWRNLSQPADVTVWLRGKQLEGRGAVLMPQAAGYAEARQEYAHRWRRVSVPPDEPVVRITF